MGAWMRLAALAAGAVSAVAAQEGVNEVAQGLYTELETWPCSRVIADGKALGCGSPENVEVSEGGVLYGARTLADIDKLAEQAPGNLDGVAVVLDDSLLDRAAMDKLLELHKVVRVDNVIVTISADGARAARNPDPATSWNTEGDGMAHLTIPFSMSRLRDQTSSALVWARADENTDRGSWDANWQHRARFQFYMGKPTATSQDCLARGKCDPLGGLSVWATVGQLPKFSQPKVLLTAAMDSTAHFHDLAFGRNKGASGIAAVLLAAKALADVQDISQILDLPSQIIVALFQGEAWGRVGSRRFVRDIGTGLGCEVKVQKTRFSTCEKPAIYSLAWQHVELAEISTVIAVDQVAEGLGAGQEYFAHVVPGSAASAAVAETVLGLAAGATKLKLSNATRGELPPSSLDSFLEGKEGTFGQTWSGTGIVVSGYDTKYADNSPDFHSRYDTTSEAKDEEATARRIAELATVLARAAFVQAGGDAGTAAAAISVDEAHAVELWGCLAVDMKCELAAKLFGLENVEQLAPKLSASSATAASRPASGPVPLFTSVYRPYMVENDNARFIEAFVRLYLADFAVPRNPQVPPPTEAELGVCNRDIDCLASSEEFGFSCPLGNSSFTCIRGLCKCGPAFFHDAVDPSLHYDDSRYVLSPTTATIYTEPTWAVPSLSLYKDASSSLTWVLLLLAGVASTVSTYMLATRARRALQGTKLKLE